VAIGPISIHRIAAGYAAFLLLNPAAWTQVRIPDRASKPLYKGEQGKQKTELQYDPGAGVVTLRFLVQDPNGYFIPNIRPEDFAVFEDGVRMRDVSVTVEHAPVTLGLLLEYGGRFPSLNRDLAGEISRAGHQLLEALGKDDKIAVWTYGDSLNQFADFSRDRQSVDSSLLSLKPPEVSETNLYDAVISAIGILRPVAGRKAIVLISSGVDTFSKAKYEDALAAARESAAPIYAISLGPVLRDTTQLHGMKISIDWKGAESKLQEIARASGGRLYSPDSIIDLSATYDDMMENLKVRYVITYHSPNRNASTIPRKVRVELQDPKTGKPLQITDAHGRPITASVIAQQSYTPASEARP
jgi:VWFA-related protein